MNDSIRTSPFAGTWYPGGEAELSALVDGLVDRAEAPEFRGALRALVAPHAGLKYSGAVAASAYACCVGGSFDTVVLLGPSHRVAFEGVAVYPSGGFETPLGIARVDEELGAALVAAGAPIHPLPDVHAQEHSLEMQLPFIQRVLPSARIVPLVMGRQSSGTIQATASTLATVLGERSRRTLLVASSDLSHYEPRARASAMDGEVLDCLEELAPERLSALFERNPHHACGGGPMIAVMLAARSLGATRARVCRYGDSGDVSGDVESVVGYVSSIFVSDTDVLTREP